LFSALQTPDNVPGDILEFDRVLRCILFRETLQVTRAEDGQHSPVVAKIRRRHSSVGVSPSSLPDWGFMREVLSTRIRNGRPPHDVEETVLQAAVKINATDHVRSLMAHECPVGITNSEGNNVVHVLCIVGASSEVAETIISACGTAELNAPNESGDFPVHIAVRNRFGWLLVPLAKANADFTIENIRGETPLGIIEPMVGVARRTSVRSSANFQRSLTKPWWRQAEMDDAYVAGLLRKLLTRSYEQSLSAEKGCGAAAQPLP
jgi:hypothetical protein